MDYGRLVREAWATTWRARFLWPLGALAGGTSSCSLGGQSQWSVDQRDLERITPDLQAGVHAWLEANLALIVGFAIALALVGIVLTILGLIAQGAMSGATIALAEGRPVTLGQAWRTGTRYFWRYLGMWLSLALATLAAGAIVAIIVVAALALGGAIVSGDAPRTLLVILAVILLGIPVVLSLILVGIAVSIVIPYAQRAIVAEDVGPWRALGSGFALLRATFGHSIIIWLINVGLSLGAGIAITILVLPVVLVVGAAVVGLWAAFGLTAPTIVAVALGVLAVLAVSILGAAIANTFFWNYWTLAYLELRRPAGTTL